MKAHRLYRKQRLRTIVHDLSIPLRLQAFDTPLRAHFPRGEWEGKPVLSLTPMRDALITGKPPVHPTPIYDWPSFEDKADE